MTEKHSFALYIELQQLASGKLTVPDADFVHRIKHVLRLDVGDEIELFTHTGHARAKIDEFIKKDTVILVVGAVEKNHITVNITVLLPVLKVGTLSDAVYALAEIGVRSIQLVYTQKSQHSLQQAQFEKLQRVIIAAAEQSKCFAMPTLTFPQPLSEVLLKISDNSLKLYADWSGACASSWMGDVQKSTQVTLLVGPEGDLTQEEKTLVLGQGFTFSALTATVLRAVQAVSLFAGMVHCCMMKNK